MQLLSIRAGAGAARQIRREGLSAAQVTAVFGASGAAKWLSIYGLDRAIFGQWLAAVDSTVVQPPPVPLFGTSVGAFKLAAACHPDAGLGLDALAEAYIQQDYSRGLTPGAIDREFDRILQVVVGRTAAGEDRSAQILAHPRFRFGCGAVRCHGALASDDTRTQTAACVRASLNNLRGRGALRQQLERIVFHDPRAAFPVASRDGYRTQSVPLNSDNLPLALKASGSIPVYMHGVRDIPGAGPGVYRDGGMLDYHPVPGNFWPSQEGLILYPHFYPHFKMGWFDKHLPWRRTPPELLDRVVMLHPTRAFYALTELGRNPDRKDFVDYARRDGERVRLWQQVADLSRRLGEEFLELADRDRLAERVQPLAR